MPVRPDVGDEIEFLDELPEVPALPVRSGDAVVSVGSEVDELVQAPVPSLAEQRTHRRFLRGLAPDVRGEVA